MAFNVRRLDEENKNLAENNLELNRAISHSQSNEVEKKSTLEKVTKTK